MCVCIYKATKGILIEYSLKLNNNHILFKCLHITLVSYASVNSSCSLEAVTITLHIYCFFIFLKK